MVNGCGNQSTVNLVNLSLTNVSFVIALLLCACFREMFLAHGLLWTRTLYMCARCTVHPSNAVKWVLFRSFHFDSLNINFVLDYNLQRTPLGMVPEMRMLRLQEEKQPRVQKDHSCLEWKLRTSGIEFILVQKRAKRMDPLRTDGAIWAILGLINGRHSQLIYLLTVTCIMDLINWWRNGRGSNCISFTHTHAH